MKYRPGRVHVMSLVGLAVLGLVLAGVAERSRTPVMQHYFVDKMEAASRTRLAMEAIRDARLELGLPIDVVNDPNGTGLIGEKVSPVTTSRGSHEQKLRALDPNLAGVFVDVLKRAGVREGDRVAIGCTGAFPLMNAGMIIAVESLGGVPVTIPSVGASMWGANHPDLTWLDMESILLRDGIISHRSVAASVGGSNDRGRGLPPDGRELVRAAIERNSVRLIDEPTLDESIDLRMEIYEEAVGGEGYRLYVNIGGGLASIGSTQTGRLVRSGLWRNLPTKNFPRRGTLVRMAELGVPVFHVPGPDDFIERYELAAEPVPQPEVGTGGVFYQERYNAPLAGVFAVLYVFIIFVVVRIDLKHYLFRKARS
ncbi:poly-gamma-glutamate system protein [bacterium]|nr:poly-gamma-glutamate system protein [bacterium]